MTATSILATGIAWFIAVVAWLIFSPGFAFGVRGRLGMTLMLLSYVLYMFLLLGWILPTGVGIYRLAKHR